MSFFCDRNIKTLTSWVMTCNKQRVVTITTNICVCDKELIYTKNDHMLLYFTCKTHQTINPWPCLANLLLPISIINQLYSYWALYQNEDAYSINISTKYLIELEKDIKSKAKYDLLPLH